MQSAVTAASVLTLVDTPMGAETLYILSTSGRPESMRRYRELFRRVLGVDIAYIVINAIDAGRAPPLRTSTTSSDSRKDALEAAALSGSSRDNKIDAKRFCDTILGLQAIGGAISKDIKGLVIPHLQYVEPRAAAIGAVNTVVRRRRQNAATGQWEEILAGYNTDAEGFAVAVEQGISGIRLTRAVVYGYGGVTNVAVRVLQHMGFTEVTITGRRPELAAARAKSLGVDVFDPTKHRPELLVNAAPVSSEPLDRALGLLPALQAVDHDGPQPYQRSVKAVFDHELQGKVLEAYCAANDMRYIPGSAMYWPQMVRQWEILLDGRIPPERLAQAGDMQRMLQEAERLASSSAAAQLSRNKL